MVLAIATFWARRPLITVFQADTIPQAWRCEIEIHDNHFQKWKQEANPEEMIFLVSAAKKTKSRSQTFNSQHQGKNRV